MHRRDEPAPTTDLDDNAELLGEVRRLQEEVRVVYDAIDELREAIDQITRGYRQDDWRPVQPRQIVSLPLAPTDPEFARKINSIEPSTFPPDLPAEVVGILTTRLAADRRGDPNGSPPHSESFPVQDDVVLVAAGPVQQRSLWNGGGNESDVPPVRPATVLADAAAEATPQKEAERGSEPTDEVKPRYFAPLAGHELVAHMQRHKVTIAGLAKRTGIAQKRIRQAREAGLSDPHAVRDWLQAIIGRDPGAVGIRVARDAYTLDDWIAFRGRCVDGEIDAATLQAEFRRMQAGKQHFIETLLNAKSADQLRLMAQQRGHLHARRNTKQENAAAIYRGGLSAFTLGDSVSYQPLQETYEEAVERIVLAITDLAAAGGDDPVKKEEDDLRGKDLPGFFPTPRPVIERMLDHAAIEPTHCVLEPSCGKGDILDAIRREHPDITLVAVERNLTLQGVLTAKGHEAIVEYGDFLYHDQTYDRILMNPPFEQGQDMAHVRHAYHLLANGGRVVAVMSEGPFFREDANCRSFRSWLDELTVDHEELPGDAFTAHSQD